MYRNSYRRVVTACGARAPLMLQAASARARRTARQRGSAAARARPPAGPANQLNGGQ